MKPTSLVWNRPTIILQPPHSYYEAFYINQEQTYPSFEQDLSQYCLWDLQQPAQIEESKEDKRSSESTEFLFNSLPKFPKQRKRIKAVFKPFIVDKSGISLRKAYDEPDKEATIFKRTSKSIIAPGHRPVKPRSNFIGVSKNGNHWQSLIVINNTKVYLGTYKTQKEAAVMFDFHSLVVHYKWAKVNFNYSADDLIKMIQVFKQNSNEFDANLYFAMN